ncbi:MAG: pyridoxal-dependent decarboxylase [Pseudomonadota bacterium]
MPDDFEPRQTRTPGGEDGSAAADTGAALRQELAPGDHHPSLDPEDWAAFRAQAHAALDTMLTTIESIEDAPVWQPMPQEVRDRFTQPISDDGQAFQDVLNTFERDIAPFATGNRHPLFMGWVHGSGTPVGMVAEMLSAGLNANCGGRDHVGLAVEAQIVRWATALFGFPATASGLCVTGTSMANFLAVLIARDHALGHAVRATGLREAAGQLTAYASVEAHGCVMQALEMAGIGRDHVRLIDTDATGGLSPEALQAAIARDRAAGLRPFYLAATAGAVNTGAFDDLQALSAIAEAHDLWFHIDGAFGALTALAPALAHHVRGIDKAHSIAFDFHKWGHVPYDAGFLLVRDGEAHKATFAAPASYLQRATRGLAAGETWPCDLGPDLSRGFRALKVWFTLQTFGARRIGESIAHCCTLARVLEAQLAATGLFDVVVPARLNVVCWRVRDPGAAGDALNGEIIADLHEQGLAVPSPTTIGGRAAMRAAIINHRTTHGHIDRLIAHLTRLTREKLARL